MTQPTKPDDPDGSTASMTGRVALVTGSARGIGAAVAGRLLSDGWTVYGLDTAPQTAEAGLRPIQADVRREHEIAEAMAMIDREAGRLDGLVSNAGIMVRKPIESLGLDEWTSVLSTNLTGLFLLARAGSTLLRRGRDPGAIVAIGSTRARMSEPDTESYAASKGGLVALTHALAISFGPGIRANCVSPGWIDVANDPLSAEDHAQHPAGRVGVPADVAALVAWLLGPESGFVTGAEFVVDGGMTRKMIYAG